MEATEKKAPTLEEQATLYLGQVALVSAQIVNTLKLPDMLDDMKRRLITTYIADMDMVLTNFRWDVKNKK